jgi:hypothetical protein
MGGFKNEALNAAFEEGAIITVIAQLTECTKRMKADCVKNNNPLRNDEDKITNRLAAKYLNVAFSVFRYEIQSPENFDEKTDTFIGRTDIKVTSLDYCFRDSKAYYTIECKRIDGKGDALNKKYITDGVARFVCHPPKYSSYYGENIMFAYVVQAMDISANTASIARLQSTLLIGVTSEGFKESQSAADYRVYSCEYVSKGIGKIKLHHLFYDLADVVYTNK